MIFSFGQSEHERIEIDVLCYERQSIGDHHDDNWLMIEATACVGGFHGKVGSSILAGELSGFLSQLRVLFETLRGSAELFALEGQLRLHLTADGKGHIEMRGQVADRPGSNGNQLHFTLRFDQSQLGESIRELEKVSLKFPVRRA